MSSQTGAPVGPPAGSGSPSTSAIGWASPAFCRKRAAYHFQQARGTIADARRPVNADRRAGLVAFARAANREGLRFLRHAQQLESRALSRNLVRSIAATQAELDTHRRAMTAYEQQPGTISLDRWGQMVGRRLELEKRIEDLTRTLPPLPSRATVEDSIEAARTLRGVEYSVTPAGRAALAAYDAREG